MTNEAYLSRLAYNVKKNKELNLYDKDNVYSIGGWIQHVRRTFQQLAFINPGPSLEKHIDEVIDYKTQDNTDDGTAILCSDICTQGLLDIGVVPDFVITLDPNEIIASYFAGLPENGKTEFVCSSASPIHKFYSPNATYYLYNAVEEINTLKILPPTEITLDRRLGLPEERTPEYEQSRVKLMATLREAYTRVREKADHVEKILHSAGVLRKYTKLMSRGTIAITMYQLAYLIKKPAMAYGFDFAIEKGKPYAEFITKGVFDLLMRHKVDIEPNYSKFKQKLLDSVTDGKYSDDMFENEPRGNHMPAKLQFYLDAFTEYSNIHKVTPEWTFIFRQFIKRNKDLKKNLNN